MNHVLQIRNRHYVIRQHQQKLILLTFPELVPVSKFYINATHSYLNPHTHELLILHRNEVTLLSVAIIPLQLAIQQQSFIQWQPKGGVLMKNNVALFGDHCIAFYGRGNLMQKLWEIDIVQEIESIGVSQGDLVIGMKVQSPSNTLFLWNLNDPSPKPQQDIVLTQPITQWQFIQQNVLTILTPQQLRVYYRNASNQYNLYNFYIVEANAFSWVGHYNPFHQHALSVNSALLVGKSGQVSMVELHHIEQRTQMSELNRVGEFNLDYKGVKMKRVVASWGEGGKVNLVCQTKNQHLFAFQIDKTMKITERSTYRQLLGAKIEQVSCYGNVIAAKEDKKWKYYWFKQNNDFQLIDTIQCDKAFPLDKQTLLFLRDQHLIVKKTGGDELQPLPLKYPSTERVHLLEEVSGQIYLVNGIRFLKLNQENSLSACGFSIRNEKAVLIQVDRFARTLLYRLNSQFVLMSYKLVGGKVMASTIKSSDNRCVGMEGGRWAEQGRDGIRVGTADKLQAEFPLSRLYKILDHQNKQFEYSLSSIGSGGLAIQIKNYTFFLQLIQDEKGCDLLLLKRLKTVLYKRFDPQANNIRLIQPNNLTFWIDNSVYRIGNQVNPNNIPDPFSLPETILSKQLELRKLFPPHHPRVLRALIETNQLQMLFRLLQRVEEWFSQKERTFSELYEAVNLKLVSEEQGQEQDISRIDAVRLNQLSAFFSKFAADLLENMNGILLKEKNPFVMQSMLSAMQYYLSNPKLVDYFSQGTLILLKTPILKGQSLSSMHVALLTHSLNQEEAVAAVIPEKMTWEWMQHHSTPFWYQNPLKIKAWLQEIAAHQYRKAKEPFDCLFWYVIVGKVSILANLFSMNRHNSKQHQAMMQFLKRNFAQPKNSKAAIKNAYVLIDKKRYLHAMAFFILAGNIQDCIRVSIDRLKDLNLAQVFCLLFKDASSSYLIEVMKKGDPWMKHMANKMAGKHILSYNCLFEEWSAKDWGYQPELTGFHPMLGHFASRVQNSLGVKRELDQQNTQSIASQDIFADFYGGSSAATTQPAQQKVALEGDPQSFNEAAVNYYLSQGLPLLALMVSSENAAARDAYNFERYKVSGEIEMSMGQVVAGLQDKVGIAKCFIFNYQVKQLKEHLQQVVEQFRNAFKDMRLTEVIETKKYVIGELLQLGFTTQTLLKMLKGKKNNIQITQTIAFEVKSLTQLLILGKIFVSLLLESYEDLTDCLNQHLKPSEIKAQHEDDFWRRMRARYDSLKDSRKEKYLKQMDHFEHAFIAIKRKEEDLNLRFELELTRQEGAFLLYRFLVVSHLATKSHVLVEEMATHRDAIGQYLFGWVEPEHLSQISAQFRILIKEGSQSKLKLNVLKSAFEEQFAAFYDVVAICHNNYFEEPVQIGSDLSSSRQVMREEGPTEIAAVEIFKNRQDGVRDFIINKHEPKGLECIVMFKRGLKKFQVCESLAKRDRNRESLLTAEDTFYTNIPAVDPATYLGVKYPRLIHDALTHILEVRAEINGIDFPRTFASYSGKEYLRNIEPSYLDYNQLNSIQCHPFLPFFFIGGKGYIEVAHTHNLKNFDRVRCQGLGEIVKVHTSGQRVTGSDSQGNLSSYHFDSKFTNPCVFSLKKAGIVDFCYLKPSIVATISNNACHIYDTLLQPKHQLRFKQTFTKDPFSIKPIGDNRIAVLRKNEVLFYDTRYERLQSSRDIKGKSKSMLFNGKYLLVGESDSKVKVFNTTNDSSTTIRVGPTDEREREKTNIEQMRAFGDVVLALNSEGSIFCLPKVQC